MTKTRFINWHGEITTRARLGLHGLSYVSWGLIWLLIFLVLPLFVLVAVAFVQRGEYGQIVWQPTSENFWRLLGYGPFGWNGDTLTILIRSAGVAGLTTLVCLLLSYPLAFWLANKPPGSRYLWLSLVIVPLCTNLVVRANGWMLLLSSQLPPAKLAQSMGVIPEGSALYPSPFAVYLGMISSFLPFATLPLYATVERLDWSVVEAARDLYASRRRVFLHAILPQTLPGLTVALVLTFVPAMGMFVVPNLLGGAKYMLVGDLIQQQFGVSRDQPYGAALSLGLMFLTLIGLAIVWKTSRKAGGVL